jgi:protein TonB
MRLPRDKPMNMDRAKEFWWVFKSNLTRLIVISLLVSVMLHLILLAIHFHLPVIKARNLFSPPLRVVLVNSKSATPPEHPDALAQSNLDGGGNTDEDRQAKSPLPAMSHDQHQADLADAQQQVNRLEEENRRLMMQFKSSFSAPPNQPKSTLANKPVADQSGDAQSNASSLEMAQLEAQIAQQYDAYQKRPRKLFLGARTQESASARYEDDWCTKIERIGTNNYPDAARQQNIHGELQLTVTIKADGSVASVEVTRSSGYKVLDNAAIGIVRLAAPFSPLPEEIRKKYDELVITRTWSFERSDQLTTHQ